MSELDHVMERVCRIVAADQGLNVVCQGVRAFAYPGHVVLPSVETYSWLGANAARMIHGLGDHETGHSNHTDFEAVKNWRQSRKPPKALDTLANVMEDGYVEARQGMRYIGCGQNLELMNEWFYANKPDGGKTLTERVKGDNLWDAFLMAMNPVCTPHGSRPVAFFKDVNPTVHAMLVACAADLAEYRALFDRPLMTSGILVIAERIYDRFNQAEELDKNEEPPQPPEGCDQGDEPDDTAPPTAGDDGEEGAGGDDTDGGDDAGEGASEDEGEVSGEGGEKEDGEDRDRDQPVDITVRLDLERWQEETDGSYNAADRINVIIGEVFDRTDGTQPYTVFNHDFDAFRDFSAEDLAKYTHRYTRENDEARAAGEQLGMCFEAALRAKRDTHAVTGHDEGVVDPDAVVDYAVGSLPADQLYLQFVAEDSDNVAVAVLCDCSGSMGANSDKSKLCRQAAMGINQALAQCQIAHEISGFTTLDSSEVHGRNPWATGMERHFDDRFRMMREALLQAYDQGTNVFQFAREFVYGGVGDRKAVLGAHLNVPFHALFKSFERDDARGLMEINGLDQNLDGEAVLWQAQRLAKRQEPRKVMFVLSDGYPAGSRDNDQGARYLEEVIKRVIAAGIEVYGLGICSDAVADYYPLYWVCNDLDDLCDVALTGLTEVLTMNRQERQVMLAV